MREKTMYLAGAMSCHEYLYDNATKWRDSVEQATLQYNSSYNRDYGVRWDCLNPCDYFDFCGTSYTDKEVMNFDLNRVRSSDVVLVNLADLDKSTGTTDEILYAWINKIPVIGFLETNVPYTEEEIKATLHPWKYEQIDKVFTGNSAIINALEYIFMHYRVGR